MTPKEQYEERRAKVREARAKAQFRSETREDEEEMMTLLIERLVNAAERIADALERKP